VDFETLRTDFPDIAAWIKCADTINYPIVQARDNVFYLNHFPDGEKNAMGSIFLDYRNAADFSDANVFIYGHNARTGEMFGTLKNYASQNYFEKFSEMKIFTPTKNFILKIFAGYVLDSRYEVPPFRFENKNHFENFIADIKTRSIFESEEVPKYGENLVFLCTCARDKNKRLIIAATLCILHINFILARVKISCKIEV
jgi:sortase B